MNGKLRVVHVGCGGISNAWLKNSFIRERVDIVAFVDLNSEAAEKCARSHGYPSAEAGTDLEAILSKHHPDAVFDCTIPAAHKTVTLTALAHGCHVLGEKPMADSLEAGRAMVAAARKAGRIYAVTQTRRYDKNLRRFVEFLQTGVLGRIETVQSDFFIGAHFGGFRDQMRHVLLLDMAIHTFDAARLIAGANPQSVICEDWNPLSSWYRHGASAVALFRLENNIRYLYHGSWCAEGLNTPWECNWRVIGSKGTAIWDGREDVRTEILDESAEVGFFRKMIQPAIPEYRAGMKDGGHAGVIADFLDCLSENRIPETVCTDNIHSLAMVMAAIESADRNGERVDIRV